VKFLHIHSTVFLDRDDNCQDRAREYTQCLSKILSEHFEKSDRKSIGTYRTVEEFPFFKRGYSKTKRLIISTIQGLVCFLTNLPRIFKYDFVLCTHLQVAVFLSLCRFFINWKSPKLGMILVRPFDPQSKLKKIIIQPIKRILIKRVDGIFTTSLGSIQLFTKALGVDGQKVIWYLYGVDTIFFRPREERTSDYMLAVGNAFRDDELLIKCVEVTGKKLVRVTQEKHIRDFYLSHLREKPSLTEKIELIHNVRDDAVRQLYSRADFVVLLLSAENENAGLSVLLEAMAMGKAVIVTKGLTSYGVVEDGKNAILVNEGDLQSAVNAIGRLSRNEENKRRLGANARRYIEQNHSYKKCGEYFYHRILEIVENRNHMDPSHI
jgi:glycosyltransferase involved in cell wall biosynthesis